MVAFLVKIALSVASFECPSGPLHAPVSIYMDGRGVVLLVLLASKPLMTSSSFLSSIFLLQPLPVQSTHNFTM